MSEKQLGKALLELDAARLAGVPDARQQTWRIVQRDSRRVWWLTVLTVVLWAAALVMVLLMLIALALLMPLQAKLNQPEQLARLSPEMQKDAQLSAQITFQMITVGITASVGILSLAAISTVILVLASRRATLRQINASLLEISQQLAQLRPAPPANSQG
jgi:hypothetical protein